MCDNARGSDLEVSPDSLTGVEFFEISLGEEAKPFLLNGGAYHNPAEDGICPACHGSKCAVCGYTGVFIPMRSAIWSN